jgi:hypothetical protein
MVVQMIAIESAVILKNYLIASYPKNLNVTLTSVLLVLPVPAVLVLKVFKVSLAFRVPLVPLDSVPLVASVLKVSKVPLAFKAPLAVVVNASIIEK